MASACSGTDPQPASDGRGLPGEALGRCSQVCWGRSYHPVSLVLDPHPFHSGQTRRKSCEAEGAGGERQLSSTLACCGHVIHQLIVSLQDFLPAPTLLPSLHELDLFKSVRSSSSS